ncbi:MULTISPECIES: hypothetical protein [unclassified Ruegeria]|uniref:hypothetical protein n=1 Tax=unclassified Ruegeria TaxID=2625375 RepID=UPI0020C4BD79|nr:MULTISPECIES: hypothetical protein [unclassified Ruegeria]
MSQHLVHFDHRSDDVVEAAMLNRLGQTDAEDLQQSPHFVGQIIGLTQRCLARAQEGPDPMCLPALHVNRTEPPCPQDLGNATCFVAIRLVTHR